MTEPNAAHQAAEQKIFRGAQDGGLRILGLTSTGEHETVLAGSKDAPVEVGARTSVSVRVAEDGTPLPRRENSDASTPDATSILEIEVIPSVERDADGQAQVVWNAYVTQTDVATGRVIATSRSTPDDVDATGAAEQMVGTPEEAVAKALGPIVSGGKLNEGKLDLPPVVAAPADSAVDQPTEPATDPTETTAGAAPDSGTKLSDFVKRAGMVAAAGVVIGGTFMLVNDDDESSTGTPASEVVADADTDEPSDLTATEDEAAEADLAVGSSDDGTGETDTGDDEPLTTPAIECAAGQQADDDGDRVGSGAADAADELVAKGTNIQCSSTTRGSYVFTMVVEGDGEAVTQLENLRWYNPRFIVNSDPDTSSFFDEGGFTVDVKWSGAGGLGVGITDVDRAPIPGAEAVVEWVDTGTLVVTVTGIENEPPIINSRIELVVRLENGDGRSFDYEDNALFVADAGAG